MVQPLLLGCFAASKIPVPGANAGGQRAVQRAVHLTALTSEGSCRRVRCLRLPSCLQQCLGARCTLRQCLLLDVGGVGLACQQTPRTQKLNRLQSDVYCDVKIVVQAWQTMMRCICMYRDWHPEILDSIHKQLVYLNGSIPLAPYTHMCVRWPYNISCAWFRLLKFTCIL